MSTTSELSPSNQNQAASKQDSLLYYHPGPSYEVPSLSIFCLKLETYFRMAGIPYQEVVGFNTSSKGKVPFIKHNGKEIADSNFIIPYLNGKYEIDLNASLNDEQKATAVAYKRLIEENLYWTLVHYRWIETWPTFSKMLLLPGALRKILPIAAFVYIKPKVKSSLHGHGMGRHSNDEIKTIAEQDVRALSSYLGTKPFFMGDEPTEVDASVFGFVAQVVYATPDGPPGRLIKESLRNLFDYAERMKEKFFPDWDQKVRSGKKEEVELKENAPKPEEGVRKVISENQKIAEPQKDL